MPLRSVLSQESVPGRELRRLVKAYQAWQSDDGPLMAAAVAYYVGLSLFPLLLILIAGVGIVLQHTDAGQQARQQVVAAISEHVSPLLEKHLFRALESVQDSSAVSGYVGMFGVLLTALAGFAQFQAAFDRIWNVPAPVPKGLVAGMRRILIRRGIAFLMLLGLGLLVVAVFLIGLVLAHLRAYAHGLLPAADWLWGAVPAVATLLLNSLVLTLIYRWLPPVAVGWTEALRGGAAVALAWEVGRQILGAYLVRSPYSSAYGVVGSFIAILLWCYYAVAVVLLGAEYVQQLQRSARDQSARGGSASGAGAAANQPAAASATSTADPRADCC